LVPFVSRGDYIPVKPVIPLIINYLDKLFHSFNIFESMENIEKEIPVKKKWQKPDFFLLGTNVNSGGVPGGVEGQLTINASPPLTSGSIYHS
jgi:hypothetical protein